MLLDDDKRFVELIIENMMWGNVKFNWDEINDEMSTKLSIMMGTYVRLHKKDTESEEIEKLIKKLALEFRAERVVGTSIVGELRDIEQEVENKELKTKVQKLQLDNTKAVEQLSQVKSELDELQGVNPVDKGFHGFK